MYKFSIKIRYSSL